MSSQLQAHVGLIDRPFLGDYLPSIGYPRVRITTLLTPYGPGLVAQLTKNNQFRTQASGLSKFGIGVGQNDGLLELVGVFA